MTSNAKATAAFFAAHCAFQVAMAEPRFPTASTADQVQFCVDAARSAAAKVCKQAGGCDVDTREVQTAAEVIVRDVAAEHPEMTAGMQAFNARAIVA